MIRLKRRASQPDVYKRQTQRWRELIGTTLDIVYYETVYYPEYDQTNRLFLAEKE